MILNFSLLFALYVFAHWCDLLVQADCWQWNSVLPKWWDRTRRTSSFYPRDDWHWMQMLRNLSWMIVPAISMLVYPSLYTLGGIIAGNALARGIGFSLIKKLRSGNG